jgi:hypothetical protein
LREAIRLRLDFDEVLANALRFIELHNRGRPQTQSWMRMFRQDGILDEWPSFCALKGWATCAWKLVYDAPLG